jgi:DNA polymerase III epsilon subunit-like protein
MCEVYPGPRCSPDMDKRVNARRDALALAEATHGENSPEAQIAKLRLERAISDWESTPDGLDHLEQRAKRFDNEFTKRDLARAVQARTMQVNALKEIENGRVDALTVLYADPTGFYSNDEIKSVIESAREEQERYARKDELVITEQDTAAYLAFLDRTEKTLRARQAGQLTKEQADALQTMHELPAPDILNAKAYDRIRYGTDKSKQQLFAEFNRLAGVQGTTPQFAAAYYEGYRKQYLEKFAHLDKKDRPDAPKQWIRGEEDWAGYAKNYATNYAPHDPASMYALYRLRNDENAIPDHLKVAKRLYASIDLETASPAPVDDSPKAKREALSPRNSRIIEVGIVVYNARGKEVDRYQQLIRPEQAFLDQHGTGAEDVHHISADDLRGQPDWDAVKMRVAKKLEGKVMLGHNVEGFEKGQLTYHVPGYNQQNEVPIIDTLDQARKHYDLKLYKLENVCGAAGIEYNGKESHRALYDADVTGRAHFAMKRQFKKVWNSKPARRSAPILKDEPLGSRWMNYAPQRRGF